MAKYGAYDLRFAAISAEPEDAIPTYAAAKQMAEFVKLSDAPEVEEVSQFGDNKTVESLSEFKKAPLDIEITELDNDIAAAVLGSTLDEDGEISFGDDIAPFGGLGFISTGVRNNKNFFQGVLYPKTKAVVQGEEFASKGDKITLANGKLKSTAFMCNAGAWKKKSEQFPTASEAKAWLDLLLPKTIAGTT